MSSRLCLVLFAASLIMFARPHRITVRGTFYCDNNPNAVVLLELREKDLLEEDLLNWKLVHGNGPFEIDGHDDELFGIQPYLRIRHNCNSEPMEMIRNFGVKKGAVIVDLEQVHLEKEELVGSDKAPTITVANSTVESFESDMTSTTRTSSNEGNGKDADDEDNEDEEKEVIQNIYLHICNEEGREFTGVTTFHGMIRIFTSGTWTSLIFWVIVVSTSLVFFMIFSGYILSNYAEANTFMRRHTEHSKVDDILVLLCRPSKIPDFLDVRLAPSYTKRKRKGSCLEMTASSLKIQIYLIAKEGASFPSDMYIMISSSSLESTLPIYIRDGHHHRIFVEASQQTRLASARAPCTSGFSELKWLSEGLPFFPRKQIYSLQLCERMQILVWSLREKRCVPDDFYVLGGPPACKENSLLPVRSLQKDYPCHPACSEMRWRTTVSHNRIRKNVKISIDFSKTKEMLVEVRKLAITDVLSLVGGGTSLFLGCSCVTLMETFIFLLKLVLQSVNKEAYEGVTEEEGKLEETSIGQAVDHNLPPKAKGFDVKEELDAIASTTMLSPPRKSIHCVRFLSTDENEEGSTRARLYRPHPPSLAELRTNTTFNILNSHNIERSLKNLPISQRLTFDRSMEQRHLRRQSAVEISDENLDQYLSDPSNTRTRSFVDDFDRKHPARLKIRRISSVTSRGSASSSRTNVHIVEHARRRSQIYNKFMTMNDF